MKKLLICLFLLQLVMIFPQTLSAQYRRCLWVWNTSSVIGSSTQENILLNQCNTNGITDIYLYASGSVFNHPTELSAFIAKSTCMNIRVWGMDGWRGYFSDLCGPDEFYAHIENVIDYNASVNSDERFFGFHGDNEFHVNEGSTGCGPGNVFHLGYTDANLSTTSGGLWQSSARADRDSLMSDFVKQTAHSAEMCHEAGLEYSIAVMPWITGVSWTNAAMGQQNTPLMAVYQGTTKPLFHHLLDYVDEYVVMSYHTNVTGKVVNMCEDILDYADGLPAGVRPRILSGVETYCDVGEYVSYCDTPGENTKSHVLSEINLHTSSMGGANHVSFSGTALHDWAGWSALSPVSSNSTTPSCAVTTVTSTTNTSGYVEYNSSTAQLKIVSSSEGKATFQVCTTNGMIMHNQAFVSIAGEAQIQLAFLPQGIYLYQIVFENGYVLNGKMIVLP